MTPKRQTSRREIPAPWQAIQDELDRLRSELKRRDARLQEALAALRPVPPAPAGSGAAGSPQAAPESVREREAYERLKGEFRAFIRKTIPRGACIAVATRGDDELLPGRGIRAEHFPQTRDGVFAGFYPPDGTPAIVHVESLRAKGIEYLVFPQTSVWWLDAYPKLARHLAERFEIAGRLDGVAVAYRLERSAVSGASSPHARIARLLDDARGDAGHAVSVLDWRSGLQLAERLPAEAVFTPGTAGDCLPYLERSIDVVVVGAANADRAAEARRVARVAVVRYTGTGSEPGAEGTLAVEFVEAGRARRPSVSIIVPTFNGIAHLEACLRSLQETLPDPFDGEVLVVDDASASLTARALRQWARALPWLRVLRNSRNLGFISSCNRGARTARGEYLVFLNDDTVPQPGWLDALLRTFALHPDAGAVGGRLVYPDGRLQEAGGVIYRDGTGANFGRDDFDVDGPLYAYVRRVSYCSGALLATPAALFRELGGFDRRYRPAYYEDTDYCFAVRESGRAVYYQPDAVVIHLEGATSGTDLERGIKRHQAVNRERFRRKWRHRLEVLPERPARYTRSTWHRLASAQEVA